MGVGERREGVTCGPAVTYLISSDLSYLMISSTPLKFGLEGWGVKIGRIYGTVFFRLNDSESSEKKILSDPVKQVCVYFAVLVSA